MLPPTHAPIPPDVGEVLDGRFRLLQQVHEDHAGVVFDALDEVTAEVVRLRSTRGPIDHRLLGILHDGLARPMVAAGDDRYVVFQDFEDEPLRPAPEANLDRLAQLAEAILPTVADLHAHDVVHGELRPSSFWLDRHGQVRLVDLGLASALSRDPADEPFVAPERAFGREADDPRIDVFSLAALLFFHATGRNPSPHEVERSGFPAPVVQVLSMAMDARPVFRPHDAGALRRALQEALERSGHGTAVPDAPHDDPQVDTLQPTESLAPARTTRKRRSPSPPVPTVWAALLVAGGASMLTGSIAFLVAVALTSAALL